MEYDDDISVEELAALAAKEEMCAKYRQVFHTGIGLDVLVDLLQELHYGSSLDPDNPLMVAEYNLAVLILAKCGVHSLDNFRQLVGTMLGLGGNQAAHGTK